MQTIDLTDFWIDRPYFSVTNNFSILSDRWCSLNNCTIGNGKAYYYNGLVNKQQLKCIVVGDTFYFDFSANSITNVIKQQMWILKHTKGIEYKIEFVCLWEMFKLPTVEQLNEFAKIKQGTVIPVPTVRSTQEEYEHAIEEMRLSTSLTEGLVLHNMHLPLSEYVDLMVSMSHSRLTTASVRHYATIIHNYHNPAVEEVATETALVPTSTVGYTEAVDSLVFHSNMTSSDIIPQPTESLEEYLENLEGEVELPYEDIEYYATIIYNHHREVESEYVTVEDLVEETGQLDHPF